LEARIKKPPIKKTSFWLTTPTLERTRLYAVKRGWYLYEVVQFALDAFLYTEGAGPKPRDPKTCAHPGEEPSDLMGAEAALALWEKLNAEMRPLAETSED
jgi:hypothetical protein